MSRRAWILGVLGLGLAAQPALARPQPVVLVLGDSLSAGYGLRVEESWPSLLQKRLGDTARVVNASQSGETTAGGLTRLPKALEAHRPGVVVLELGGNDGLRGLPVARARDNLALMIELSQAAGAQVVLLAVDLPPNFGAKRLASFEAMYRELATTYRLAPPARLLSGLAERFELFQADQIHPTAAAQSVLLDNVWPAISKAVTRAPAPGTAPKATPRDVRPEQRP